MSKATITLIGKVFRHEERKTPTGIPFVTFAVSVSNGVKNGDGSWDREYDWYNVSSFSINLNKRIIEGTQVVAVCNVRYKKDAQGSLRLNLVLKDLTVVLSPVKEKAKEIDEIDELEELDNNDLPF